MNTQESNNDASFQETDEKMVGQIGMGLNEFTETRMKGSAFDEKKCLIKQSGNKAGFYSSEYFVSSQQELHERVEKKSNAGVNFGFGSIGHHSTKIKETTIEKRTLYLFIESEREANTKILDVPASMDAYSPEAHRLIEQGGKVDFYTNFGSKYISQVKTGYFVHILLAFQCSSDAEVEIKKKELKATFKTDDATGKASFSNNSDFSTFCKNNVGVIHKSHNIPPELIQGITNYEKLGELQKMLALRDNIELFVLDKASAMDYEVSDYPALKSDFFDYFNHVETQLLKRKTQLESSQEQLDALEEYLLRPAIYESIPDAVARQTYYKNRLTAIRSSMDKLSANPWTTDVAEIAHEVYDHRELRTKIVDCLISSVNGSNWGSMYVGTADENRYLNANNSNLAISHLGISLDASISPSDLSINYVVGYSYFPEKGNKSDIRGKQGKNGEILYCCESTGSLGYLISLSVWLTGGLAGDYEVCLSGKLNGTIVTSLGMTSKHAEINGINSGGIPAISVYLRRK